jgi:SAM-dependent methyltransferase
LTSICAVGSEAQGKRTWPGPEEFPELAAAYRPIDKLVSGNTILIGEVDPASADDSERSLDPLPAGSRVLAYEENSHFICAVGDASLAVAPPQGGQKTPELVRRFIFLKPSVCVIDDVVRRTASGSVLRWRLACRSTPKATGRQLRFNDAEQQLVCQTLWPEAATLQATPGGPDAAEPVYQSEVVAEDGAGEVRWLHVLDLRPSGSGDSVKSVVENRRRRLELTITTSDRTFRLSLPPPGAGAGHVAVETADGQTIVARRPLPSGVLPHGPEGVKLVERWDSRYRDGRTPPWDTGVPAEDLKQAVEEKAVGPCRTVVLGCGSGTNAVYLAEKGFDVTAIDVAPTALRIAAQKARKADVRVRWMLADVLALPELEPFDFIFDRGCYHNVRYADADGFVDSLDRLSKAGTKCLVLSLNRDGPPGVREQQMRDDFSGLFDFEWLRASGIQTSSEDDAPRPSWSLMLRRKGE